MSLTDNSNQHQVAVIMQTLFCLLQYLALLNLHRLTLFLIRYRY